MSDRGSGRSRFARRALPTGLAAVIMMLSAPALAHVEVESDNAVSGAQDVTLTFHVPNEKAPASTVQIRILMPDGHPLIGVRVSPQHGFGSAVKTRHLSTPIQGPDGAVSDVAEEIDFTGGHIRGDDEPAFAISVRQLPSDSTTLTFKTLQTYSTGEIVRWIEVAADGAAEPEHPAPALSLRARAGTHAPASGPVVTSTSGAHTSSTMAAGWLAGVAVTAGVALAGVYIARRSRQNNRKAALGRRTSQPGAPD